MLFNFQAFIEELREKNDKKEVVEKYEKFFGPIVGDIKEQLWYKEYLINFKTIPYSVPEELQPEFDWNLLLQLVAGSFSSECFFDKQEVDEEGKIKNPGVASVAPDPNDEKFVLRDLTIAVKSGDQSVVKKVAELWSFQVMRLYEIYIEEQMNLQILIKEEEKEAQAIISQRQARLQRWKTMFESFGREELAQETKKEQESKLGDLMNQL